MGHLSSMDVAFLHFETPQTPMLGEAPAADATPVATAAGAAAVVAKPAPATKAAVATTAAKKVPVGSGGAVRMGAPRRKVSA